MASYRRLGSDTSDLADWMGLLPVCLTSIPLRCLAIPGSHASFSCTVSHFNDISPDNSLLVKVLGNISCCVGRERIYQWSRTQDLSVTQQLTSGVRYFEAQVAARSRTGDFRVVCGLYGDELRSCMTEIKSFLDTHEKEVIILDINNFYNMDDILHMKLLSIITHCFDDKLCPFNTGSDVSLNSLWNQGYQVIVIYHHEIINEYDNFWPGTSINYYPPVAPVTSAELILQLEKHSENAPETKYFKCLRGIVSYSKRKCLSRLSSSRKHEISTKVTPEITTWLQEKHRENLNIVIVDYMHLSNFVRHLVYQNASRGSNSTSVSLTNGEMSVPQERVTI